MYTNRSQSYIDPDLLSTGCVRVSANISVKVHKIDDQLPPTPLPASGKTNTQTQRQVKSNECYSMIQCRDAFRDMRTAKWLTLAPHCHYSGHTFRLRPFHMKNDRRDRTLPSHNNGYLYAEKNRPHPICLPFQHHEYPTRIQQFDADDNWDITDIDGIKNETPMVLIQRYNGFYQGIRNKRLGSITEEEETSDVEKTERSKDNLGTLYSRHSLDSTTDYASDDEEETEYDGNVTKFEGQMAREHGTSNLVYFQGKAHLGHRSKPNFSRIANEKWPHNYPVNIRNVDNFLLHKPTTSTRATNQSSEYGLNPESEEYFQTQPEESEACDSEEFPFKKSLQVQKYFRPISSKMNNCNSLGQSNKFQDLPGDVDTCEESSLSTFKSFNQNQETTDTSLQISENDREFPVESFSNNLNGNAPTVKTENKDITSGSDSTDDNFYKTFLPSSLAENESVTKINPIAILCANQNEEERSPNQKEIEIMPMQHDDKEKCFEKMEKEFDYSIEDFPHPPDHFFDDLDSFSLSSVSLVTENYEDKIENDTDYGQSKTPEDQIYQSIGHLTFVVTNKNNDESVDSSSDCFSEFARQSSRESDFISESVSTEFTFEANPSDQKSTHAVPMATLQIIPNDDLENGDSSLKFEMLVKLNNNEQRSNMLDTEELEDMNSKQISDTLLQSCLSLKDTTSLNIGSKMEHQEGIILPQCRTNSETCLHLNKQNFFDIISTKHFNQASKMKKGGIKTNGGCLHNECDLKSEYDESGSVLFDKAKSASVLCFDHSQEGDQSVKARLSAVQNMLQRAITIDKICYTTKDNSSRKRGSQWK